MGIRIFKIQKYNCSKCGREIIGKRKSPYCKYCKNNAKSRGVKLHTCKVCGKVFEVPISMKNGPKCCSDECEAQLERKRKDPLAIKIIAEERIVKRMESIRSSVVRKCHDCGKKTINYRCTECYEKWKKLNKAPLSSSDVSADENMDL